MQKKFRLLAALLSLLIMSGCSASYNNENAGENQSEVSETVAEETSEVSEAVSETEEAEEASADDVIFSCASGVYGEEFDLELSCENEGEIYYTLDGSDPTVSDSAVLYSAPVRITDRRGSANVTSAVDPLLFSGNFNDVNETRDGFITEMTPPDDDSVDKITVIRAAVKNSDGAFGRINSSSYFIGTAEEHIKGLTASCAASGRPLAVVSISMEHDDLFDSTRGIYVKGDVFDTALSEYLAEERLRDGETARSLDANYKQRGREWERKASVSIMEMTPDSTEEVISMQCGIRVQGNYSRSDLIKGFRLFARSEYGDNNFRYPFFGTDYLNDNGETMDKFKTIVLRAGGNCAFTSKYNDTYWQSLLGDTAVETQHTRPCVVYLNGEYWGLYIMQEDYTEDYFEDLHGVDKDTVVVCKGDAETYRLGYKLDVGEAPAGEGDDYYYRELNSFFRTHRDLSDSQAYEEFSKLVDVESVRDYFAAECWINNKWDWPGKNWSMWKTTEIDPSNPYADGRWRFMFNDMEFGGVSGSQDVQTNTIKEDNYKPLGLLDMDTNNPAVLCFAYLMTNEGFRADFYAALTGLSEGYFEKHAAIARLEEFEAEYSPLFDAFFERYPGAGSTDDALYGGYASSECIRAFVAERENYIQKLIDYCEKVRG